MLPRLRISQHAHDFGQAIHALSEIPFMDEAAGIIGSAQLSCSSCCNTLPCCKRQVIKASIYLCIYLLLQPFDRQVLSVGGSRRKDGLSIWRWFPRQRQRAKHSITVIDGDTKSHGHNHTPSASGKYQPGGLFQSRRGALLSVTLHRFPAGQC